MNAIIGVVVECLGSLLGQKKEADGRAFSEVHAVCSEG